MNTEL